VDLGPSGGHRELAAGGNQGGQRLILLMLDESFAQHLWVIG
jgi:hypothetical protein